MQLQVSISYSIVLAFQIVLWHLNTLLQGKCWYRKLMVSVNEEDDHVIEDEKKGAEGRDLLELQKAHVRVSLSTEA